MKSFLPLGTVVQLKDENKKLVIVDRLQRNTLENKVYDYAAHLYPEGKVNKSVSLFNNEDIAVVIHRGYSDAEEEVFIEFLNGI